MTRWFKRKPTPDPAPRLIQVVLTCPACGYTINIPTFVPPDIPYEPQFRFKPDGALDAFLKHYDSHRQEHGIQARDSAVCLCGKLLRECFAVTAP